MSGNKNTINHPDNETHITLGLLNAIHENSSVTQRTIASELGIALGLTNSYLKRSVKKGLIKIAQAPANRYVYYLTPKGFAEKSQLTARYLTMSFDFFRHARTHCEDVFDTCSQTGLKRICFVGASDLAEIAILCASSYDIEIIGFIDNNFGESVFADRPVFSTIDDLADFDALVITDLSDPQKTFDDLSRQVPDIQILTPGMLNISRTNSNGGPL